MNSLWWSSMNKEFLATVEAVKGMRIRRRDSYCLAQAVIHKEKAKEDSIASAEEGMGPVIGVQGDRVSVGMDEADRNLHLQVRTKAFEEPNMPSSL